MQTIIATVGVAVVGLVANVGGYILAAEGTDFAPLVSGGGTATAVAALVWIAKKIVAGELVPRNVAALEQFMREQLEDAQRREDEWKRVNDDLRREKRRKATP